MTTTDPRMPSADDCVIRDILENHARDIPDAPFALFPDGDQWTYADTLAKVRQTAAGLQALGIKQGDHVFCWLPTGADCLKVWFAINYLGAVYVPANLAYKGGLLEHVVQLSHSARIRPWGENVRRHHTRCGGSSIHRNSTFRAGP